MSLPARFDSVEHLEDVMTEPSMALIQDMAALEGDIMVLGVGGKMGPTLARMAKRAAPNTRVIGVARQQIRLDAFHALRVQPLAQAGF